MKKTLSKIAGIATMFAMTFGVAFATPAPDITICHMEGNGSHTITVNANAWPGHQNHGDYQGECEGGDNNQNCDGNCEEQGPVCPEDNLLVNGGFEAPVAPVGGWDEYDSGTPGLGWTVAWNGAFVDAPATAKLELHNGVNGWLPYAGSQHAELDADWGYNDGEQASVSISQDVVTIPGATYDLNYAFSARPGTDAGENVLEVLVEGAPVQTQGPVAGAGNTSWATDSWSFVAADAMTTITFRDAGTPNTLGTFLDDVSLNCEEMPPEETCPAYELVMARINFSKVSKGAEANGWKNWAPGGDVTNKVFVGGTNPLPNELAGNVYDDEEWFPLTNPDGSFITDPLFSFDVPGVAVQRVAGSVRVVLYGFHNAETLELGGKEYAAGMLEISSNSNFEAGMKSPMNYMNPGITDGWDNLSANPRLHDAYVNDAANPMDGRGTYTGYINQYDYRFDRMKTATPTKVSFTLVATTASDGFYAHYDIGELDCLDEEVTPQ